MDVLALRVAARYTRAGIFEPPPKLFKAVRDWAFRAFAGHALARANHLIDRFRLGLATPTDEASANLVTQREECSKLLYDIVRQFEADRNFPAFERSFDISIPGNPGMLTLKWKKDKTNYYPTSPKKLYLYEQFGRGKPKEYWIYNHPDSKNMRGWMHDHILERFDRRLTLSKRLRSTSPEQDKQGLVEAFLLQKEASKYTSTPKLIKSVTRADIDVVLSGWKYLTPEDEKKLDDVLVDERFMRIHCQLFFEAHTRRGGQWDIGKKILQIDTSYGMVSSVKGFHAALEQIESVAYHETQHVGQDVLRMVRGLSADAGLPSTTLRTDRPTRKKRPEHALRDTEFYTDLKDAVRAFRKKLNKIPVPLWRETVKTFVGQPPGDDTYWYFQTLLEKAPEKWRKAVSEFTKEIEPILQSGGA